MRFLLFIVVLSLLTSPARAWGEFGHVLICEIAYRSLTEEARTKLKELIDQQSFRDEHDNKRYPSFNHSCLREDKVRRRKKEHYVNYPRELATITSDKCPSGKCVLSAIRGDSKKLADKTLHPNDRFASLMALGHWIGDIHQPLHVSFADDRGGNDVKKRGPCGRARNLHAVWDSCILERKVIEKLQPEIIKNYSDFTPMYRATDWMMKETTKDQIASWIASKPLEWANESFNIARRADVGYCIKKNDACWYSNEMKEYDGNKKNKRTFKIDNAYLQKFKPVVVLRLKQAGYRLGAAIEKALSD